MARTCMVAVILVCALTLAVASAPVHASETQWGVNLRLNAPLPGLSDATTYMGVRPGATDGYDLAIDAPNPIPPPGGDYVDLYFHRPTWPFQTDWAQDWRSVLAADTSKIWGNLRAVSTLPGEHVLSWTLGAGGPGWEPLAHYSFWIFDEGESPDPTGGVAYRMSSESSLSYWSTSTHHFRVVVYAKETEPPLCSFTWSPAAPKAGESVNFDGGASVDPDGVIVSWDWDFGDGGVGSGVQATHAYAAAGDYTVTLTVTDDDGLPAACQQMVTIAPGTCVTLAGNCWHLITLPCQPVNPDPWEVLDELRPPNQPVDLLSGNLHRYDHDLQGYVTYYEWASGAFDVITPGDGYWLWLFEDVTICYEAECPPGPQSVYFASAGWYLMGSPQLNDTHFDSTLWYQGASGPSGFGAIADLWVQDPLFGYRCDWAGYFTAGLKGIDDDHYLRAFNGYWMYAFVGDVTLEVPAPPSDATLWYQVGECTNLDALTEGGLPAGMAIWVSGRTLMFHHDIEYNCCPDFIRIEFTLEDHVINIYEVAQLTQPCYCICYFPTDATIGPLADGEYVVNVYDPEGQLIATQTVTVPS